MPIKTQLKPRMQQRLDTCQNPYFNDTQIITKGNQLMA